MAKTANGHDVDFLKRQAKTIKKAKNITHTAALNIVAISVGYKGWRELIADSQ